MNTKTLATQILNLPSRAWSTTTTNVLTPEASDGGYVTAIYFTGSAAADRAQVVDSDGKVLADITVRSGAVPAVLSFQHPILFRDSVLVTLSGSGTYSFVLFYSGGA